MMFQPDVCCFKNISCDVTGISGYPVESLIGGKLGVGGGGGKPPQNPPRHGGGDDNDDNMGDHALTWKGKALLAFAAASMFLGLYKAHDVAQDLKEFKESIVAALKHCPTDQNFNCYRP